MTERGEGARIDTAERVGEAVARNRLIIQKWKKYENIRGHPEHGTRRELGTWREKCELEKERRKAVETEE